MSIQDEFRKNSKWYAEIQNSQSLLQVKVMKICFLYPFQDKHFAIIGKLFVVLYNVVQILGMIVKLIEDTSKDRANSSCAESLVQLIASIVLFYDYSSLSANFNKILVSISITSNIRENNDRLGQKMIDNMLRKAITYNSIITILLIPITVGFGTIPIFVPIISSWILPGNQTFHKTLPILYDFHINTDKYFYPFYVVQLISLSYFICICLSMVYLQSSNVAVIIGQFQYMQYYLKQTDNGYYELRKNKGKLYSFLKGRLKQVIKQHCQCIKLYKLQQSISNPVMLVTLLGISSILIISGTTAVISINTNLALAPKMMAVYCAGIVATIAICTPSQFLHNASYNMFIESYCINWYEYPPKARLLLVMLLVRTQKIFVITVETIIDLNFETCSTVIKKSLSFIAAFRSLYATL